MGNRFNFAIKRSRESGFTLIELMVSLSVMAVLLGVGAPSFGGYLTTQRIRTASFNLTTDLMLARSEAIKRNTSVVITPHSADWSQGWTVTQQSTAEEIRVTDVTSASIDVVAGAPASIAFDNAGRVADVLGTVRIGLRVVAWGHTVNRCISLDPAGMPKTVEVSCS